MNQAAVRAWVEGYRRAWERNDPRAIGALFTDDATYAATPFREPVRGREAIVEDWLASRDEPGETTFHWETVAIDGDVAVVRGHTTYADPPTEYRTIWTLHLTADGRCTAFAEWWMERERPQEDRGGQ